MSTTPPEPPQPPGEPDEAQSPPPSPPPPPSSTYTGLGASPTVGAILPVPGNAELAVFLLIEIVFVIIWAASDRVDAGLFMTQTAIVTFAYLISRGIAKASRVLEQ
jgi:hypothetical protein